MSFLITGTGRCGTTWAYQVLHDAGIEVRHQSYRHEHALGVRPWSWDGYEGEVSYEAGSAAHDYFLGGRRVILL